MSKKSKKQKQKISDSGKNQLEALNLVSEPIRQSKSNVGWLDLRTITKAGEKIDEDNMLSIDVVFSACRVLAEEVASLPLQLKKTDLIDDEQKHIRSAKDHPLYDLMTSSPNGEITAYDFWISIVFDMLIRGKGCAQILRDGNGNVKSIWPLQSKNLTPVRDEKSGELLFKYKSGDTETILEFSEVLYIDILSSGSLIGYSILQKQRELLSAAKAAESYSSEFFRNNGVLSGVIETTQVLDPESFALLKNQFQEQRQNNRHGVPILEAGMKFNALALDHEKSQLLQTRLYSKQAIAALFRIPPIYVGDSSASTFTNSEQQSLSLKTHTLRPWMINIQQRCNLHLLTAEERKAGYHFKFNDAALLMGDYMTRTQGHSTNVSYGGLTINETRRIENRNPVPGGDVVLVNSTLMPLDAVLKRALESETADQ